MREQQMEPFFPALLEEFISSAFLEKVQKKFHFSVEHSSQIESAAKEMLPLIHGEAFFIRRAYSMGNKWFTPKPETTFECVAMSLGSGVDLLQERYVEKGLLLESYIVEVLSSELLLHGYDAYNQYITKHTTRHVARYYFPGSEETLPLEMLPALLQNLTHKITCNAAFCMQPKKSVVFISELTQDEAVHCQAICIGCPNKSCPNRMEENNRIRKRMTDLPLPYGYSRIFGIIS